MRIAKHKTMKKISILFILILSGSLIIFSCSKDDEEKQEETSKTVVEFMFNKESDLEDWDFTQNDSATMMIDKQDKVEGLGSLKIQGGCCVIGNEKGYSVEKNTNYRISLDVKYIEMPEENSCGGAFLFMFYVYQGSDLEDFGLHHENAGWYNRQFYFNSGEEGLPIQFRIRSELKDVWIDNFIIEKAE